MPRVGRAKYHSPTLKSNQGTGSVVSNVNGMGRGLVLRKQLIRRVGAKNCIENCYTSFAFFPKDRSVQNS